MHIGPSLPLGPRTETADNLHQMKYRSLGESFKEAMNRMAGTLSDSPEHFRHLQRILQTQSFLGGGRTQAAVGSTRVVTAINCFVMPDIRDSYVDGENSIMDVARKAAATMRMGGGVGYNFGTLRPKGDLIKKLDSYSSGPISFMRIFNEVCLCTSSAGHRRGAQMGILPVWHPDIEEFIHSKQDNKSLTGFNISVAVTDEFMKAVEADSGFTLRFDGREYRTVRARDLWESIMRSTWDWAEPGIIFIDRINEMNNLWYCENISATNPCGEQPLPPNGACLLGSFNLVKYLIQSDLFSYSFDWDRFKSDIPCVVRAMDNIIDRTIYPLPEQKEEEVTKRRMGLGVTGLANCIEALGFPYGSKNFLFQQEAILRTLRNECYRASVELAKAKGPFKVLDIGAHSTGAFIKTLPETIQRDIELYGIRNSHLTSIAPTGTISMCADNVSSGLEPVFSYSTNRTIQTPEGPRNVTVEDYGIRFLGVRGKLAADVTAQEHLDVLSVAQQYVDSAVSKTVNMTSKMPWSDFKDLYMKAWKNRCKGLSTFRQDGKRGALLVSSENEQSTSQCTIDLESGRKECG